MNVPEIKEVILGKRYDLSVAFLDPREMRKAMAYKKPRPRKGAEASNVLSFPLSPTSGEILLCRETAKAQCKRFGMNQRDFLTYLLIHGMLHLKGFKHGATMESEERRALQRFGAHVRDE